MTVLEIFLASPDDVREEREIAREVVESISRMIIAPYDISLKAVGWEDAIPSLGDPQDLINKTRKDGPTRCDQSCHRIE